MNQTNKIQKNSQGHRFYKPQHLPLALSQKASMKLPNVGAICYVLKCRDCSEQALMPFRTVNGGSFSHARDWHYARGADFAAIWPPRGVGGSGAFPRRWKPL